MLFTPRNYKDQEYLMDASYLNARSDTIINGQPVFGFVNGIAYAVREEFDEFSKEYYSVAGDIIF